jgi:hypothetical protein
MMSFNDSMFQFMPGAGMVVGGAIAALAGARVALAVAGAGALAITATVWVVLRPGYPAQREERLVEQPPADGLKPRPGPSPAWSPPSTQRTHQEASGG